MMKKTFVLSCSLACAFLFATAIHAQETNVLTPAEEALGFELLFDGKALSPEIWQDDTSIAAYPVENGAIVYRKGTPNLFTKKEYANFIFRFEFKLPPAGNNGVGIRAASVSQYPMEIQILDNSAEQYRTLEPYQYHGSLYGVVPAKRNPERNDYLKPVGEWNYQEIIAQGTKFKVILNGEIIVDADLAEYPQKPASMGRERGFVGFLGHDDPVEFRSIRIKALE